MELTHRFTVPAPVETTWAAFNDIESVAGCFPGAVVTEVDGDDFKGSCKVKLGPIALVYNGTGSFVEKDEAAHRFVVDAKGKDKRGNGTAGATVRATLTDAGGSTEVTVVTDLAITGKPAQFGRGVIEDVSNKLLGQFVACLEDKVGAPAEEPVAAQGVPEAAASAAGPGPAEPPPEPSGSEVPPEPREPEAAEAPRPGTAAPRAEPRPEPEDALDLGATVLPILARTYWKQALAVAVAVAIVIRRLRRR